MDQLEAFQDVTSVSRETLERLQIYANLLKKWNPAINLVSKSTLDHIWERHFLDSAVAYKIAAKKPGKWVDLGSGAGFPGLVLAILAADDDQNSKVTCIETDLRKSEFLRTVARNTGISVNVLSRRIEDAPPQSADCIFARALAPLTRLLEFAEQHVAQDGFCVFHKGQDWKAELESAQINWQFDHSHHTSPTDPSAVLLCVKEIARV